MEKASCELKDSFQYNINNNDVDYPNQVKDDMAYRYHTDYNNDIKLVFFLFFVCSYFSSNNLEIFPPFLCSFTLLPIFCLHVKSIVYV